MDGQRSSICNGLSLLLGGQRYGIKLRFVHEPQRGIMQFAQGGFRRFEAGEFYEVTILKKPGEALFLIVVERAAGLEFGKKFLGRAFRSAQLKSFLEIKAEGLRDLKAKEARIVN